MGTPKNHKTLKTPLSTIKKGPVKGLRNILAHPQEFLWPIVKDERGEDLKDTLNKLLPNKKHHSREISWAQLRKMSKEERAALKKANQWKKIENKDNEIINSICLGVNAVTRALEKDSLASVLVDSNVEPLIMIKHVVTMSQNNNIPVILVSFLKNSTLQRLGFASAALGLNKSSINDETSHFHKLHVKISNLAEEFPKTKNPIQLFDDETNEEETEEIFVETPKQQQAEPFKLSTSVYLHRKSIKERVFIPPDSQKTPENEEKGLSEFISLGDDIEMEELNENASNMSKMKRYIDIHGGKSIKMKKNHNAIGKEMKSHENENEINHEDKKNKKGTIYRPLKVKRVQGSPQRLKATKTPKIKKKSIVVRK